MTAVAEDEQPRRVILQSPQIYPGDAVLNNEELAKPVAEYPELAAYDNGAKPGIHPLLQQIQSATKVIQITSGRQFVCRPLCYDDMSCLQNSPLSLCSSIDGAGRSSHVTGSQRGRHRQLHYSFDHPAIQKNIYPHSDSVCALRWDGPSFQFQDRPSRTQGRFNNHTMLRTPPTHYQPLVIQQLLNGPVPNGWSRSRQKTSLFAMQPNGSQPLTLELESILKGSASTNPAEIATPFTKLMESHSLGRRSLSRVAASSTDSGSGNVLDVSASNIQRPKVSGAQWLFDAAVANRVNQRSSTNINLGGIHSSPLSSPSNIRKLNSIALRFRDMSQYTAPGISGPMGTIHPVSGSPVRTHEWQFSLEEDVIDEEYLFRRDEMQRRKNPRYLSQTKRLHDLHIVMPLCIPAGIIEVDDPQGANYYKFPNEKFVGANILFGKGVTTTECSTTPPVAGNCLSNTRDTEESSESRTEAAATAPKKCSEKGVIQASSLDFRRPVQKSVDVDQSKSEKKNGTPACDVWASFLHVRLGTIYNLDDEQVLHTVDRFKTAFDTDLCHFYVPIAINCRGIYPSTDDLISQRAGRPSLLIRDAKDGKRSANERYETRGTPTTENDIKRLQMLKRYLKRFARGLVDNLGFNSSLRPSLVGDFGFPIDQQPPMPSVELHDNCRTSTLTKGSLKIVIREWSKLNDPEVFKKVWNGRLSSTAAHHGVAEEVWSKLLEQKDIPSARVLLGEVDPRWNDELVLGRRVADHFPHLEAPDPDQTPARFVFCSRVPKPKVVYAYAKENEDPRDGALNSRLSPLFKVHLSKHPYAGISNLQNPPKVSLVVPKDEGSTEATVSTEETELALTSAQVNGTPKKKAGPFQMMDLKELPKPFVPRNHIGSLPQTLKKLMADASEAATQFSDRSALKESGHIASVYAGGCARANNCYFLHPVDPSMESKLDVRHVVPKHPKFF